MRQRAKFRPRIHSESRVRTCRLLLEALEDRLPPGDLSGGLAAVTEPAAPTAEVAVVEVSTVSAAEAAALAELERLEQLELPTETEVEGTPVGPQFEAEVLGAPFDFFTSATTADSLDLWGTSATESLARFMVEADAANGMGFNGFDPVSRGTAEVVTAPAAPVQNPLLSTVGALEFYAGLAPTAAVSSAPELPASTAADVVAAAPLSFEANAGQTDARVDFLARGPGYTLFLTPGEAVLSLQNKAGGGGANAVIRMDIVGGSAAAQAQGQNELAGKVNYFLGNDVAQWQSGVATYGRVEYQDVYPGINLAYYSNAQNELEYDFIVAPGANSAAITLNYTGADRVALDAQGDLMLQIGDSQVRQHKPFTYQEVNGSRQEVASRYVLQGSQQVGFAVGAYDASLPLVIDPVLAYSTFLGGNGVDLGRGVAVDPYNGLVMVTGLTMSSNFPTLNPDQAVLRGGSDAFVAQYNRVTGQRVYATYLGGTGLDSGQGVAIDPYYSTGYSWVTGTTSSADFPASPGSFQPTYGGGASDAFIALLTPQGVVGFATFVGGNAADEGLGIAVDANFQPYITGSTTSANFPTTAGALQTVFGDGVDSFVTRLDFTLSTSDLSTYLGGEGDEFGFGIGVDLYGDSFVTGSTGSDTFPTTAGAYQPVLAGSEDAFLVKLTYGGVPVYSTYLGGVGLDVGFGVAVDTIYGSGYAWITGSTASRNFPRSSPSQSVYGGGASDAFLASFDATGGILYSTYLGGSGDDQGLSTAVDGNLFQFVTGATDSTNFPRVNALQNTYGGGDNDAFVTQVGYFSERLYSTYFGGSADDQGLGIAVDFNGLAYVAGMTASPNFQRVNAHQTTYGGGQYDAFLSVLS